MALSSIRLKVNTMTNANATTAAFVAETETALPPANLAVGAGHNGPTDIEVGAIRDAIAADKSAERAGNKVAKATMAMRDAGIVSADIEGKPEGRLFKTLKDETAAARLSAAELALYQAGGVAARGTPLNKINVKINDWVRNVRSALQRMEEADAKAAAIAKAKAEEVAALVDKGVDAKTAAKEADKALEAAKVAERNAKRFSRIGDAVALIAKLVKEDTDLGDDHCIPAGVAAMLTAFVAQATPFTQPASPEYKEAAKKG